MAVNDIKTAKLVTEDRVLAAATAPQKINWSVLYMNQHLHAAEDGWRKLIRNPLTTLMTVIVIAVALALPAAMLVLLENVKALSAQWHNNTDIALYLQLNLPDDQARNLLRQLEQRPEIAKAKYISPSQGWQELQQQISMPNLMDSLKENPLPGVIIVTPKSENASTSGMQTLVATLQHTPGVETAQFDMEWLQRFYAILAVGKRLVWAVGLLLGIGVLFIIGNAIHLSIQKYHREIEVYQLVGASDRYIRRPFLYAGILYGLFGSILAGVLISVLLWSLQAPTQELVGLYHSDFRLHGMDFANGIALLVAGMLLGVLGARLAVGRYLRGR